MRISTSTIYESGSARISDLTSSLNRTQQQIAAQRKILTPEDDPIGSARALVISQSDAINDQYAVNRKSARNNLSVADGVLGEVTSTLHEVKSLVVQGGNGALTDLERGNIADAIQGNIDRLFGLANSTDGVDSYLFSGFSTNVVPYTQVPGGAKYNGDQGQRYLQVDSSRQVALSDVGSNIFGNIKTSAEQFNVVPNPLNAGGTVATAVIDGPTSSELTGNNYEITFDNTAAVFTVKNTTTGVDVIPSPGLDYESPQTVTFDGISVTLADPLDEDGNPKPPGPGDHFTIQPGNQNIFETLTDVINTLRAPVALNPSKVDLLAGLTQANNNLDKSLSNVLVARTKFGTSLKELDELDSLGESTGISYKQELSQIQDIDYVKAISDLNQQQVTLQAAQQSFIKTSALSLFNYIN